MSSINHATASGSNMSLDGGYTGSLDHAIANLHVGRHQGRAQGIEEGIEEGYQQGFNEGHVAGWNEASNVANQRINEQMAFTRQHIAEKEQISINLQNQRVLIEQLDLKIQELEQENLTLRNENTKLHRTDSTLRKLVDALKGANNRLQDQVNSMDEMLKEKTKQYSDQLWQYNRSLVFMNAVRGVIEDLTSDQSSQAEHVRKMFAEKYAQQVNQSLNNGAIKAAPDSDNEFAKALPRTRKFIVDMLNSVGKEAAPNILETAEDCTP